MGYTNFKLEIRCSEDDYIKILEWRDEVDGVDYDGDYYYELCSVISDRYEGTWLKRKEEMIFVSLKFPNVLFVLDGYQERQREPVDVWRAFYRNGKSYSINPEFSDFDELKLKAQNR